MSEKQQVTFADFEIRYNNIRKAYPKVPKCSVRGCSNPHDSTELGEDTCCSYHRLLFDFWSCDVAKPPKGKLMILEYSQKGRRRAFNNWMKRTGREECDKIVLVMAQDSINWVV